MDLFIQLLIGIIPAIVTGLVAYFTAKRKAETELEKVEKNILKKIDNFTERKTIILITHKLSNVTNADEIYLLKHGEIIEQGNHKELLRNKKEYYKLWLNQF